MIIISFAFFIYVALRNKSRIPFLIQTQIEVLLLASTAVFPGETTGWNRSYPVRQMAGDQHK